ncbi:MAG TPA: flavin oxidoreductase [Cyanobacteria bacterium UBA11149]|nr:flavin oxidoreductase [Cyanobacteria bacterium UBA11367]HBE57854.1 flavin oxidoreductase [Cyanobacteria bacterium UBA11366]HBK61963.1 flavin oxidoreductase [Cyanobacteria bacterium UBA11166]HBR76536.1 flavin oxidoreductase [Cyanobacteria bacterium UBA11159]HBS67655.1 flavin oxidoreductase [Cyanobacteria bacterium UBA11153]HBW87677.1 flavin oxidoreductase [Cyanobacteria bacterium UBA11149]HCA96483.1 flavin oxidoreductase [Cyanobacteria bacterium UBA9226]
MTEIKPRDVQVSPIGTTDTTVLRSRTWDRLKFEVEYSLQKGTTANSYLIQGEKTVLIDPPGESFTAIFLSKLQELLDLQQLDYIILGHVNPNRIFTLKSLLELAPNITLVCSKPGAVALRTAFPEQELKILTPRPEDTLDLGKEHQLQFITIPTPRWPDGLCTFDSGSRILFTDKLFGSHVCGDAVFDENWKQLDEDRRYYYDCLHASQAKQVEAALDKLALVSPKFYAPGHGSIIRYSLSRLTHDYRNWSQEQKDQELKVALIYASAYGNTATLAQALAKGITKAGVAVESINCEFADTAEIEAAVQKCDGFIIGSPTLGGHMPTQVQTALGIVLSTATKTKLAGVFGSFGWSGEAVDEIETKLKDAGYRLGFESIRVKFKPNDITLQQCKETGTDFAQELKKSKKVRAPWQSVSTSQIDRTEQAVGRVVGSLCVLSAKRENISSGMLASWVTQASFNPPGITVAIAKDRAVESLTHTGDNFVLNILQEGKTIRRHFLKPFAPGEDRFAGLNVIESENGCPILNEALAYLECTVKNRMECGDHWLVYAGVNNGKVLQSTGITAVHHRKSGSHY